MSNIRLTDDTNTNGAVLLISTLDLNSQLNTDIRDVAIDSSEISFVIFSSLINSSPTNKLISLVNINYTNTNFNDKRALLSTSGIELDTDVQISMTNLLFSNLSFSSRGTLIECKQQLPTYLTIVNSRFSNLNAAILTVESSNTQNTNLRTLVQINDTVFNDINDRFNSFINVKEGGQLEITTDHLPILCHTKMEQSSMLGLDRPRHWLLTLILSITQPYKELCLVSSKKAWLNDTTDSLQTTLHQLVASSELLIMDTLRYTTVR